MGISLRVNQSMYPRLLNYKKYVEEWMLPTSICLVDSNHGAITTPVVDFYVARRCANCLVVD